MRYAGVVVFAFLTTVVASAHAQEPSIALAVKLNHAFGSEQGVLTMTDDGLRFTGREAVKPRHWNFETVRYVRIPSRQRIIVETYEPSQRFLIGGLRTYTFDVVEGSVTPTFVAMLLKQFPRPVLTTVLPGTGEAIWSAAAWHERRGTGVNGILEFHDTSLLFRAETATANRYWRYSDIASVLRLDPDRLEITVRESGQLRSYVFELKGELAAQRYDALWARLHRPADWTQFLVGAGRQINGAGK